MSQINAHNIDEWLFDHLEGNLDVGQTEVLQNFLAVHPEYAADLSAWQAAFVPVVAAVPAYAGSEQLLQHGAGASATAGTATTTAALAGKGAAAGSVLWTSSLTWGGLSAWIIGFTLVASGTFALLHSGGTSSGDQLMNTPTANVAPSLEAPAVPVTISPTATLPGAEPQPKLPQPTAVVTPPATRQARPAKVKKPAISSQLTFPPPVIRPVVGPDPVIAKAATPPLTQPEPDPAPVVESLTVAPTISKPIPPVAEPATEEPPPPAVTMTPKEARRAAKKEKRLRKPPVKRVRMVPLESDAF